MTKQTNSKNLTAEERAELYRRQLGGTNAALNKARQEIKQLKAENAALKEQLQQSLGVPPRP